MDLPFEKKISALPDRVPLFAQRDRELDFHVASGVVGHRVGVGVEPGKQAQAEALDVAVGADAGLVLDEARLGREAGAADVDAGLEDVVVRVRSAESATL